MRISRLLGQASFAWILFAFLSTPLANAQISVTLPDLQPNIGQTIAVPVELGNVETTIGFTSFQFRVVSSSPGLVFEGHDASSTLVEGFTGVISSTTSNLVGGYTSSSSPALTSGTLIYVLLRVDYVESGATLQLQEFRLAKGQEGDVLSTPEIPGTEFASGVANEEEEAIPASFVLKGNYPNPFNPTTSIQFDLKESATVNVSVMDMLGREMMSVPAQAFSAGSNHTVSINAASLTSGMYIYRVVANSATDVQVATGTMTLLK